MSGKRRDEGKHERKKGEMRRERDNNEWR